MRIFFGSIFYYFSYTHEGSTSHGKSNFSSSSLIFLKVLKHAFLKKLPLTFFSKIMSKEIFTNFEKIINEMSNEISFDELENNFLKFFLVIGFVISWDGILTKLSQHLSRTKVTCCQTFFSNTLESFISIECFIEFQPSSIKFHTISWGHFYGLIFPRWLF